MPTYKYRCNDCKDEYEKMQSINEDADSVCEKCNGEVVRLIGKNINIAFKGSGFYVNDNKK